MNLITIDNSPVTQELQTWIQGHKHFDPEVLGVPSTGLYAARDKDKTILYMATQTPLILGPFVVNPEATRHEISVALRELLVALRLQAQSKGIGTILVFTEDESIKEFAKKLEMEQMPDTVFRKSTIP